MVEYEVEHFATNLALSSTLVAVTTLIHFFSLAVLTALLRGPVRLADGGRVWRRMLAILFVVFALFAVHTSEIWIYAGVYRWGVGAFEDFETALYFSTVTFVSLGYRDITLPKAWRLVGAIEAANGVILLGWSTAFFVTIMARLRALEHEWLDHPQR